ncbi:MAG TPA: hypothetical protein VHS06_04970, partial [Chloroflexota bacterium]|nr:hypothetical protein [Chloroflexota bacterium]
MRRSSEFAEQLRTVYRPPIWLVIVGVVALVVGLAAWIVSIVIGPGIDNWLWLVVWFLVFLGVSQGMLVWSATLRVAQARWAPAANRVGHSSIGMLPVLCAILIVLLVGLKGYMPWTVVPVPGKEFYLNLPFMVVRDLIGLGILFILDFLMVRWTLAADARARRGEDVLRSEQFRLTAVGVAVIYTYVATASIISVDFIMAFSPEWVSTMFPPYYWCTNVYAAMATVIVIAGLGRRLLGAGPYLGWGPFQDMGNLMLGFGFFCMGLFFAQYLTIWYENLPRETGFLVVRYYKGLWPALAWPAFALEFAIPFLLLQSRRLKRTPRLLVPVAILALIGF